MEVLLTACDIRKRIRWVLGARRGKRVVLVAYVGKNSTRFLPSPAGIDLYCSTDPSGTNPYGLRELLRTGVNLFAVQRLHMKVYWSRERGAVLGSANLSQNGLGDGGLLESAVYIKPGVFDAQLVANRLSATVIDKQCLTRLIATYNEYRKKHRLFRVSIRKAKHKKVHIRPTELDRDLIDRRVVDSVKRLQFRNKVFAFTGCFGYGKQSKCAIQVKRRGGKVEPYGVTQNTDVLVIGSLGNPSYFWKKYGKKTKRAMDNRKVTGRPAIIQERRWLKALGVT